MKDVMEATLLGQQLDASYYSTISGDGSRIALIRETDFYPYMHMTFSAGGASV